jgi:hypothetical protein
MRSPTVSLILVLGTTAGCFGTHPREGIEAEPEAEPSATREQGPSESASDDFDNAVPSRRTHEPNDQGVVVIGGPTTDPTDEQAWPFGAVVLGELFADRGDGWRSLIEADWELAPGEEAHVCARLTVPEDAYLHEFAPLIPQGTHHTVLSVNEVTAPDGVQQCVVDLNGPNIYGSGVGSEPYALPEGIAMRVRAGQQLNLNLHLFNVQDVPLKGRSGVWVRAMPVEEVEHVAQITLGGPLQLEIPPGRVVQSGQCTIDADTTLISVGPHMHQLGVHMKVTADSSDAGQVVLYDGPYAFESQVRYPLDFVPMRAGDVVHVECTYENGTGQLVTFGQSSLSEMCFASLVRYPAREDRAFLCTN